MENSLLWKYYIQLTEQDRKSVHLAVRSRLFNVRPELVLLLDYMESARVLSAKKSKNAQADQTETCTKAGAWAAMHTDSAKGSAPALNDGKLRHSMAYLLDLIREVIAWQSWKNEPNHLDLHLCRSLKKYNSEPSFDKEYQSAHQNLEAQTERSSGYFLQKYLLELEQWEMFRLAQRTGEGNLSAINETFGGMVAINTLRQACATLSQKTFSDNQTTLPYLSETLRLSEQGFFADIPAVRIYHLCYLTLAEPENENTITQLKASLFQSSGIFPNSELRDIFILCINYCIKRLNAGEKQYIREALDLYREGLKLDVFLENGYLSRFTYRNILNLALGLSEWEWSYTYLHEYAAHLQPKERENIFRYNLATYYFRQPDYDKALELLRHVEPKEILYHFDARRMMLRIYYDLKEFQALDSLLESFSTYLRRHAHVSYHHKMYLNLVRFMKRFLALSGDDLVAHARLKNDIKEAQHLAERDWLLSLLG